MGRLGRERQPYVLPICSQTNLQGLPPVTETVIPKDRGRSTPLQGHGLTSWQVLPVRDRDAAAQTRIKARRYRCCQERWCGVGIEEEGAFYNYWRLSEKGLQREQRRTHQSAAILQASLLRRLLAVQVLCSTYADTSENKAYLRAPWPS